MEYSRNTHGCTEGTSAAVAGSDGVSQEIETDKEMDSMGYCTMSSLLPIRVACYSSNIADHRVFVERLLAELPEGTQFFGFQVGVRRKAVYSESCYDYQGLLWLSFDKESSCNAQRWRQLADGTANLDKSYLGAWMVPLESEGLSAAQVGQVILSSLTALERIARESGDRTEWFGESPFQ